MGVYETALTALADPTRREIMETLRDGPAAVGRIAEVLPISQPAVSQHLSVLKRARLVTERRDGTRHLYSLDHVGLIAVRAYIDRFWEKVLDSFAEKAQEVAQRATQPQTHTINAARDKENGGR